MHTLASMRRCCCIAAAKDARGTCFTARARCVESTQYATSTRSSLAFPIRPARASSASASRPFSIAAASSSSFSCARAFAALALWRDDSAQGFVRHSSKADYWLLGRATDHIPAHTCRRVCQARILMMLQTDPFAHERVLTEGGIL